MSAKIAQDAQQPFEAAIASPTPRRSFQNPVLQGARVTLLLAGTSLGVVYGDIGTSPLYVFNAIFPSSGPAPSSEDVIGALSAIIWAITLVALLKYALIALEFGNATGEGGPFAVYTALYPPPEETDENRVLTTYTTMSVKTNRKSFISRGWVKGILFTWVLFGTCLTISDGLLTPAVSVVSAVLGIAVAAPAVEHSVIPISVVILLILFTFQGLGTRRIGRIFGPVIAIWLGILAVSGIINLTSYPGVFRAFDPSRAVMLFVRTKNFDLLSGVLLSITGVEALFANLGQFSKGSIRLAFGLYVYPCLILAYLGQGARLVDNAPAVLSNIFFQTIPGGVSGPFWWITWLFGILAAVIASQAMISATFSLVQQLTGLHAMPALKIIHTADDVKGQVFVPAVNVLCAIGTIGLTVGFGTDAGLTNAYGFAVSGVMIVTTSILAIAIVKLKHLPIFVALAYLVPSIFIDSLFWGASLKKVPHGAWFPLGLAALLCVFFQFWSWARGLEDAFDASNRHRLNEVMSKPTEVFEEKGEEEQEIEEEVPTLRKRQGAQLPSYSKALQSVDGQTSLARIPIFALFHNASANTLNGAPHSFSAFLRCYPSLPQVVVFFNIRVVGIPHTEEEERYVVSRVRSFEGVYVATLRLGYRDPIDLANVATPIRDRIVGIEANGGEGDVVERLKLIDAAMGRAVTHILPNFHVSAKEGTRNRILRTCRTFLIESIYRRLKVNFVETDSYKFAQDEDVLRMGVSATL